MMHRRNNISKHIERLLLTNNKVAVPSFGIFSVENVAAEYVKATGLFYPPKRIVDFSFDKAACDTLLLQSYADACDMSFPEAQKVMDEDIQQMLTQLQADGSYYFKGVGTLARLEDKSYVFEADMAGIATPELFGLSTFEFKTLKSVADSKPEKHTARIISIAPFAQGLTPMKKVAPAAVAVLVGFSLISIPAGNGSDNTKIIQASILSTDVIHSIVESPAESGVAVTKGEIAQFEQAVNNEEQAKVQEETSQPVSNAQKQQTVQTTHIVTAAPPTVTVNISYDDMKKVVEEHEMAHEADTLSQMQ
jgi:hypothetical protein